MTLINPVARTCGVALALVGAVLAVPSPAAAKAGLTAASTLAPAGSAVVLSTDGAGSAVAAWVAGGQVQVSRRTPGVPGWTPAVTVSAAGEAATEPDVSIGPAGVAAVVWSGTPTGGTSAVKISVAPAGQAFGGARTVSDGSQPVASPQVEVGPAGIATVVWASRNTTNAVVRSKTASATTIGSQTVLAEAAGTFSGVSLARNATGDTVAAWRLEGGAGSVQVARRLSGQAWSAPAATVTSSVLVPDRTTVAIDGAGNATLGWAQGATADSATPYAVAWPRAQGTPSGPVALGAAPARAVHVAANGGGQAAATWSAPGGLWYVDLGVGSPAPLVAAPVTAHDLAVSETGAVTVAYAAAGAGLTIAHRPPGAAWASTSVPSGAGSVPSVAGHGGDATLAWSDGGAGAVQARTLDSGAPTAVHLTAPMRVLNEGKHILAGWIGADTFSPITYEVSRQVATYRTPLSASETWLTTTATDAAYQAKPGETVCLRVRGSDSGGSVSGWSVPRCASVAVNDKTLKQRKLDGRVVWKTARKVKGAYSKDLTTTTRKGATLTLPVAARRVALLVSTGRGHGSVTVSLGKDRLGTFSLASRKGATQVIVPVAVFSGVREGKLKVTVTTNGKPVRIDGIYAGPA